MRPGRLAKRAGVIAGSILLLASCEPASSAHEALTGFPSWSIEPLTATFDQSCFCTTYSDSIGLSGSNEIVWLFDVRWSLTLALVDAAGQPYPGDPGSAAAVDPGCSNAGMGSPTPVTSAPNIEEESSKDLSFVWYHPAAGVTPPGQASGVYSCDHLKQGPRGHQGTVTLVVAGADQQCTVSYQGTISGKGSDAGQPGHPVCKTLASPGPSSRPT